MGDILLSPDDIPAIETIELSGWTEEWWTQEIKHFALLKLGTLENFANNIGISFNDLDQILIFASA